MGDESMGKGEEQVGEEVGRVISKHNGHKLPPQDRR